MIKRRVGRPRNEPENLVTIDQAVIKIKEVLREKYKNEEVVERMAIAKGTIYNMRSNDTITKYGSRNCALVDVNELIEKICS